MENTSGSVFISQYLRFAVIQRTIASAFASRACLVAALSLGLWACRDASAALPADEIATGQAQAEPSSVQPKAEVDPALELRDGAGSAQGCNEQHPEACLRQGLSALRAGRRPEAVRAFELACDAEEAHACYELARLFERGDSDRDIARSEELYQRACAAGHEAACDLLGH